MTTQTPASTSRPLHDAIRRIDQPVFALRHGQSWSLSNHRPDSEYQAWIPALPPERLGDAGFVRDYGIRAPYMTGAMANGIASVELVCAIARAGYLGSFGAAGLHPDKVSAAIDSLQAELGSLPFACNLIHSPNEMVTESAVAELFIAKGVRIVEASAYLDLTLPLVRYRTHGIRRAADGSITVPNRVIAKVSRIEVARRFLSPPPQALLDKLVQAGSLTAAQAELARALPMCDDLIAESDSGGHTDNRPAMAMLPTMLSLRDRVQRECGYQQRVRVGLAGGLGTPHAIAAAFALGAAFVVTGSINQACVESGSSDIVRQMLAEAEQPDVVMAPAADMFEMGVEVQVLKRGTMFAMRAQKLFTLYRAYDSLDMLPAKEREWLERTCLRVSVDEAWRYTAEFFQKRDPRQLDLAAKDPHHKMALVFRSYLGQASKWANAGIPDRKLDYQVWCGPAMGAFNEWARGTRFEAVAGRRVADVAAALLQEACELTRARMLAVQGVEL